MAERETPGQRIRNLREAAFITQKDFAERIGVAPSQLSRIESGETKTISSDILIAIATEFIDGLSAGAVHISKAAQR